MLKTKEGTNFNHVLLINPASFPICFHQVLGEVGCINSCRCDKLFASLHQQAARAERKIECSKKGENHLFRPRASVQSPLAHLDVPLVFH